METSTKRKEEGDSTGKGRDPITEVRTEEGRRVRDRLLEGITTRRVRGANTGHKRTCGSVEVKERGREESGRDRGEMDV